MAPPEIEAAFFGNRHSAGYAGSLLLAEAKGGRVKLKSENS